jgi:hypothetical protein
MAEKRSDNSKYESRYGGGWITPAQFLAEVMCERTAKSQGNELPPKFWNLSRWKKEFLKQLTLANKLVNKYDPSLISKALRSPQGKKIFSLGAKWLKDILEKESFKIKKVNVEKVEEVNKLPTRQNYISKKSIYSRLKDIDNE